jgi:hypothetical protein
MGKACNTDDTGEKQGRATSTYAPPGSERGASPANSGEPFHCTRHVRSMRLTNVRYAAALHIATAATGEILGMM